MLCEWMVQADDQLPEDLFEALVKLHAKYLRYEQYVGDGRDHRTEKAAGSSLALNPAVRCQPCRPAVAVPARRPTDQAGQASGVARVARVRGA